MLDKKQISEKVLEAVSGGVDALDIDKAKEQFDKAWVACGMDSKDITGMDRGELFDQWLNGKVQDPTAFLKAVKL